MFLLRLAWLERVEEIVIAKINVKFLGVQSCRLVVLSASELHASTQVNLLQTPRFGLYRLSHLRLLLFRLCRNHNWLKRSLRKRLCLERVILRLL